MPDVLHDFIKDSYKAGKRHPDIRAVLLETGWSAEQVEKALSAFIDYPFAVAVPKPLAYSSPRQVFLNLFHFLVLYLAIYSAVSLIFTILDYYIPDINSATGSAYYGRSLAESTRWNIAFIICSVPMVIWSNYIISRLKQAMPRIRLKLIYLTLFIAAFAILCSGIGLIYYFLSGELGIRFIIKITVLALLVAGLFVYYKPQIQRTEEEV